MNNNESAGLESKISQVFYFSAYPVLICKKTLSSRKTCKWPNPLIYRVKNGAAAED